MIPFEDIERYRAMLEELTSQSKGSLTPDQIDKTIASFSGLEASILDGAVKKPAKPQPETDSYDTASAKVKEVMNRVYFGLSGRPDRFKTNFRGDIPAIAYDYFKRLLDDQYDVVNTQPTDEFMTFPADRKLRGAIAAYRDFTEARTSFLWVHHRDDKLLVAKVIDKVENMTFTSWEYAHDILNTIVGRQFNEDRVKINQQADMHNCTVLEYVNSTYKSQAVRYARTLYEIGQ